MNKKLENIKDKDEIFEFLVDRNIHFTQILRG